MKLLLAALNLLAAVLLLSAGGRHPYSYYGNLRVVVTAASLVTVYVLMAGGVGRFQGQLRAP